MRLKIRHAVRRNQKEIEDHFNPINLDYIFDEDDPLAPWLEEREEALLDRQDNSEWMDVSDGDDGDEGQSRVPRGRDSSGSSSGAGLSPPSGGNNDGENTTSPTGGRSPGFHSHYGGGTSGHVGGTSGSGTLPFGGEQGLHGFRDDEEIGDPAAVEKQPSRHSDASGSGSRRRPRHPKPSNVDHDIAHQFGGLGVRGYHPENTQFHHPMPPPMYPSHYPPPPPPQSYYPPPYVAYPQPHPHYYPPPPDYGYGVSGYGASAPYGYYEQQQQAESSIGSGSGSGSNSFGRSTFNFYFGNAPPPRGQTHDEEEEDDDDSGVPEAPEPPRHSFWW